MFRAFGNTVATAATTPPLTAVTTASGGDNKDTSSLFCNQIENNLRSWRNQNYCPTNTTTTSSSSNSISRTATMMAVPAPTVSVDTAQAVGDDARRITAMTMINGQYVDDLIQPPTTQVDNTNIHNSINVILNHNRWELNRRGVIGVIELGGGRGGGGGGGRGGRNICGGRKRVNYRVPPMEPANKSYGIEGKWIGFGWTLVHYYVCSMAEDDRIYYRVSVYGDRELGQYRLTCI